MSLDLKSLVDNGVDTVFTILSNSTETVELRSFDGDSTYNPTSGVVTKSPKTQNIDVIFIEFEKVDGDLIRVGDERFLVKDEDLTIPLRINDIIVRSSVDRYKIINIIIDPTITLFDVQIRKIT